MYRSHVMNTVAEAWKGWKSKIKEKFIDNEKDPTTPWPYEEGLCTKEDFEILKAQVTSPEFEVINLLNSFDGLFEHYQFIIHKCCIM